MTIRNRLADLLAEHLYDRGANVAEWPEDERALRRLRSGHYDDYCAALRRLRHEKAADALLADLTLLDDICEYRARQIDAERRRHWPSADQVPAGVTIRPFDGLAPFTWKRYGPINFEQFYNGKYDGCTQQDSMTASWPGGFVEVQG